MTMPSDNIQVFISHSYEDKPFVYKLEADLNRIGIKTWNDAEKVLVGQVVTQEITDAIDKSDFFLIILSEDAVKSNWVDDELNHAYHLVIQKKLKLLPILIKGFTIDKVPSNLRKYHCADFGKGYDNAFQKLVRAIQAGSEESPADTHSPSSSAATTPPPSANKTEIKTLIGEGELGTAIKELLDHFAISDRKSAYNEIILQSGRHNKLEKNNRMGIIARSDYQIEKNRIMHAILDLIDREM